MNSSQILDAIAEQYCHRFSRGRYLFLRELRVGTGHENSQRIDGFLMDAFPSGGMYRVAYEVKISRADFARELRNPNKRRAAMRYSNYFYFATPVGLLKPEEIPHECGLVEISPRTKSEDHWNRNTYELTQVVPAPHRDVPGPTWMFMAAALRCQMKGRVEEIGEPPRAEESGFDGVTLRGGGE